jgi:hypothetical protein
VTHKPWKQSSGKCWLWVKLCSEPTAVLMLQAHFFVPLSRDEISVLLWSPAQYCHFYFQIIQLRLWYWGTVLEFELRASHLLYLPLETHLQPFLLWLFGESAFCPGQYGLQSSYFRLTAIPGMTGSCYHSQLFPLQWGLTNSFANLSWNCSPDLGLPSS